MESIDPETDLSRLHLFRSVPAETIEAYVKTADIRILEEGEILISPREENRHLYSLLSGRLAVHLSSLDEEPYMYMDPGEYVGEMSVIEQREPSAYVVASEKSEVLAISESTLWAMVNASHTIAKNLLYILSGRLRQGNVAISSSLEQSLHYEKEAKIDVLTGLHNRRWMDAMFEREIKRCRMDGDALCLAILDVDHFKRYNDGYGHIVGDHVLSVISETLRQHLRPNDMLVRYGGDEFVMLLPQSSLKEGVDIAERLRTSVSVLSLGVTEEGELPSATVSLGISQMQDEDTLQGLISRADEALYRSKSRGRDCISTDAEEH